MNQVSYLHFSRRVTTLLGPLTRLFCFTDASRGCSRRLPPSQGRRPRLKSKCPSLSRSSSVLAACCRTFSAVGHSSSSNLQYIRVTPLWSESGGVRRTWTSLER